MNRHYDFRSCHDRPTYPNLHGSARLTYPHVRSRHETTYRGTVGYFPSLARVLRSGATKNGQRKKASNETTGPLRTWLGALIAHGVGANHLLVRREDELDA